jgi:CDP-diglyceride synthetase
VGYVAAVWAMMALLLLAMLGMALVGHRYGRRQLVRRGESATTGTGIVEGALFALLGLLIAFTFATSYSQYNLRRALAVEEANAISTAYLRLDVLGAAARAHLQEKFRSYVETRLEFWNQLGDKPALRETLSDADELQRKIWSLAIKATEDDPSSRKLLLPALNQMIDITTTRLDASKRHPPLIVFAMLFILALLCAWLIGYASASTKNLNWAHVVGYAIMVMLTIYVIIDLDYPRYGLIRLDLAQEPLEEVSRSMQVP